MTKKRGTMSNYSLKKSILVLVCLALSSMPVSAQSSACLSISVNPSTVRPGGTVGVFALVTNCSNSKTRLTVTFTSTGPCGETVLGSHRLALSSGQSIQVTVSYPLPPDACPGEYLVKITAKSGKSSAGSASTILLVEE